MSAFMMPMALLCSVLETLLNKGVKLNVNKQATLTSLNEKSLTLHLAEFASPITLLITEQYISVLTTPENDHSADCEISTSLKTLVKLKESEHSITELIRQEQLDVIGDLKVAQSFSQFLESLEIDWQTELAEQIGDIATHKLVQLSKNLSRKVSFFAEQVQADSQEWLVYEKKLVVTSSELNQFNAGVNKTAEQLRPLEQRIEQLTHRLTKKNQSITLNE